MLILIIRTGSKNIVLVYKVSNLRFLTRGLIKVISSALPQFTTEKIIHRYTFI